MPWGRSRSRGGSSRRFVLMPSAVIPGEPVEVPLVLAQRIVFGAIGYARGLGFEPHADFAKAAGHLGEWDGVCDLEFGRDGMPMYIEGPHDDSWRILHTLRQNIGDGNFHYLVGLRS